MNSTAVSPVNRPNLCACGHPLIVHTIIGTGAGGSCTLCGIAIGTAAQNHAFTPVSELWPSASFPQRDPHNTLAAGGLGTIVATTQTTVTGGGGAVILAVVSAAGVRPGMSFTIRPNSGVGGNEQSYRIVSVSGNSIQFTPGLRVGTGLGALLRFSGSYGSTMGPGRPANGQRAG